MGGNIEVESAVGKGSRFFFEIVLEKASKNDTQPPNKEKKDFDGKNLRGQLQSAGVENKEEISKLCVLLVEDNLINRKFMARLLNSRGWEVLQAENGKEAIEKYRGNHIDIILMDIQMPVMDGYEAAVNIRELEEAGIGGRVPIIALTAHAMESYMKKSYSSGMDAYLTKPIDPGEMYQTIHQLLGH